MPSNWELSKVSGVHSDANSLHRNWVSVLRNMSWIDVRTFFSTTVDCVCPNIEHLAICPKTDSLVSQCKDVDFIPLRIFCYISSQEMYWFGCTWPCIQDVLVFSNMEHERNMSKHHTQKSLHWFHTNSSNSTELI